MTRYQSTASKRTRTIAQLLVLAMITAVIVAITACSGEQPPPTHRPQTGDRGPAQTIEAMPSVIAALQTQAAQPRETAATEQPRPTENLATAVASATETPVPTATLLPPQKYRPSDNICRRSPGVQNALIQTLQMSSCRIITNDELFRLNTQFNPTLQESPRQGDFAGMTNLRKINIKFEIPEGENAAIPDQLFHGMIKLEHLELISSGKLTISSNAVHNLPKLKSITISSSGNLTIEKDFASEVPMLTELSIETGPNSHMKEYALNNLNRITELTIYWKGGNSETPSRSTIGPFGYLPRLKNLKIKSGDYNRINIQPHTFRNLPDLKELKVTSGRFRMAEDTFSTNPKLQTVEISGTTSGHKTALSKLEKLEHLTFYNSSDSSRKPEIILSPKSPLMKAILNGQTSPQGYIVIPRGGE